MEKSCYASISLKTSIETAYIINNETFKDNDCSITTQIWFGFVMFFNFFCCSAKFLVKALQNAKMRFLQPLYAILFFLSFTIRMKVHYEPWLGLYFYSSHNYFYDVYFYQSEDIHLYLLPYLLVWLLPSFFTYLTYSLIIICIYKEMLLNIKWKFFQNHTKKIA